MMHRAWSSIVEVPYCFSSSYVKFQGHTALKIVEFDPNWAFPDCNSSLNSPMAMKCCTKLETAKERCPIVFQGHPSNFKVTRYKASPILTQIRRFRTLGRSQLSNHGTLIEYAYLISAPDECVRYGTKYFANKEWQLTENKWMRGMKYLSSFSYVFTIKEKCWKLKLKVRIRYVLDRSRSFFFEDFTKDAP